MLNLPVGRLLIAALAVATLVAGGSVAAEADDAPGYALPGYLSTTVYGPYHGGDAAVPTYIAWYDPYSPNYGGRSGIDANGKDIPLWTRDYVLKVYQNGALYESDNVRYDSTQNAAHLNLNLPVGYTYTATAYGLSDTSAGITNSRNYGSDSQKSLDLNVVVPVVAPTPTVSIPPAPGKVDRVRVGSIDGRTIEVYVEYPDAKNAAQPSGYRLTLTHDGLSKTVDVKTNARGWDYRFKNVPTSKAVRVSAVAYNAGGEGAATLSNSINTFKPLKMATPLVASNSANSGFATIKWAKGNPGKGAKIVRYVFQSREQARRTHKWWAPLTGSSVYYEGRAYHWSFYGNCTTRKVQFRVAAISATASAAGDDDLQGAWSDWTKPTTMKSLMYTGGTSITWRYPAVNMCR